MNDERDTETTKRLKRFVVELNALCAREGLHVRSALMLSDAKAPPSDLHVFTDFDGHHAVSRDPHFDFYGRILVISPAEMESLVSATRLLSTFGTPDGSPRREGL